MNMVYISGVEFICLNVVGLVWINKMEIVLGSV